MRNIVKLVEIYRNKSIKATENIPEKIVFDIEKGIKAISQYIYIEIPKIKDITHCFRNVQLIELLSLYGIMIYCVNTTDKQELSIHSDINSIANIYITFVYNNKEEKISLQEIYKICKINGEKILDTKNKEDNKKIYLIGKYSNMEYIGLTTINSFETVLNIKFI